MTTIPKAIYFEIRTASILSAKRVRASVAALPAVNGIYDRDKHTLLIPIARYYEHKRVVEAILALEGSDNT